MQSPRSWRITVAWHPVGSLAQWQGGFTERLYQARQQARALPPRPSFKRNRTNWTDQVGPPASPSFQTNALPPNTGTGADNPPAAS